MKRRGVGPHHPKMCACTPCMIHMDFVSFQLASFYYHCSMIISMICCVFTLIVGFLIARSQKSIYNQLPYFCVMKSNPDHFSINLRSLTQKKNTFSFMLCILCLYVLNIGIPRCCIFLCFCELRFYNVGYFIFVFQVITYMVWCVVCVLLVFTFCINPNSGLIIISILVSCSESQLASLL